MRNSISVGLAEIKISTDPNDVLVAFGLGSCIGIGIYDPGIGIGGMLHAVLPVNANKDDLNPKYVDTGIRRLLADLKKGGLKEERMIVKMAGGANMLNVKNSKSPFDIGTRNTQSAKEMLKHLGIRLKNEETGGQTGRTVRLYIGDGRMTIRKMGGKESPF